MYNVQWRNAGRILIRHPGMDYIALRVIYVGMEGI